MIAADHTTYIGQDPRKHLRHVVQYHRKSDLNSYQSRRESHKNDGRKYKVFIIGLVKIKHMLFQKAEGSSLDVPLNDVL